MEFLVNRDDLVSALTKVVGVVERRQTLPILGNLLLSAQDGAVEWIGSDLEVEVRSRCDARVEQPGEITVPARKLADIARNLAEGSMVRVRVAGERCQVIAGRGRFSLGMLPAADFPRMDLEEDAPIAHYPERLFKRLLDKTAFAMAQQDVRFYLNGMLLELDENGVTAVATDGHRLARFVSRDNGLGGEKRQVIVPHKAVVEMRRLLGSGDQLVEIGVGQRSIRLTVGSTALNAKLIDGRYPEYERVIPQVLGKKAVVDRETLKRALARTSVLAYDKFRGVRVSFAEGVMTLQVQNPEQEEAEEEIELDYSGERTWVGYNLSYLLDVLGAIETTAVEVYFENGDSSSMWRGAGSTEETYVVMPMRL